MKIPPFAPFDGPVRLLPETDAALCAPTGASGGARRAAQPRAARVVLGMLRRIPIGTLDLTLPDGSALRCGSGAAPHAMLAIHDWSACAAVLKSGDIGFGESHIDGRWSTPDLVALLELLVANRNALDAAVRGTWWGRLQHVLRHRLRRNSRAGSRRNIHAHYDLGNDFYRLWLDESMTYSSALFAADSPGAAPSLADGQAAKYQRVLDQLALPAGARVLEIGCGWGGFALRAAEAGLSVTGLSLSQEQLAWGRSSVRAAGFGERVDLRFEDYRDHDPQGGYDGIVSIEMFEAVGEEYWDGYFDTLRRSLKEGGKAVVQAITIAEHLFPAYRKSTDFIQQYIFPGGMLPSHSAFLRAARRAGLAVAETHCFGRDYGQTLRMWLERFDRNEVAVRNLGFDTAFIRTWRFYLAYCAAGFVHGNLDVVQYTLEHAR